MAYASPHLSPHWQNAKPLSSPWAPRALWRRYHVDIGWLGVYFVANAFVFWLRFREYANDSCVGYAPSIAKGSAEVVMLNCALTLCTVCHRILDRLRQWASGLVQQPMGMHRPLHIVAGSVVLLTALAHSAAWLWILHTARTCSASQWSSSHLARHSTKLLREETSLVGLLFQLPMWTGLAMLLAVVVLLPFSIGRVRRRFFREFEWIHNVVLVPFLVLLMFHGAAEWSSKLQAPIWLVPALAVYCVERCSRLTTDSLSTIVCFGVSSIASSPPKSSNTTIRVFLTKTKRFHCRFQPGMVVYLHVPAVSSLEWHPFSVCSCQDDALVELRIRVVGDWTSALLSHLQAQDTVHGALAPLAVAARIDGPFGTPTSIRLGQYDELLLIAMGVGVSPFLSVLRHQLHTWRRQLKLDPQRTNFSPHLTLVWVVRHRAHIKWLCELLADFDDVTRNVVPSALAIEVCITDPQETERIVRGTGDAQRLLLDLKSHRPDWPQLVVAWSSSSGAAAVAGSSRAICVSGSRHAARAIKRAAAVTTDGVDVFAERFR